MAEKIWEIKDPDSYSKIGGKKRTTGETAQPARDEKDPAKAYSRSVFIWGAGQNYNGEYGKSLAFMLLMVAVCLGAGLVLFFRDALLLYLKTVRIPFADAFLAAEILLLCILLFWLVNAGDAYHGAAKTRRMRFPGMPSRVYPCLSSLLLPGWGQFLNGQPLKGSIFSALGALGIFSLVSVPAVLLAWPSLEAKDSRLIIEGIFTVSVVSAPLLPFLWLFSAYDALRVSLDDYKKEPLWERVKAANNRRRTKGLLRGVFPWIGRTFVLALILTVFAIVVARNFPARYYIEWLTFSHRELTKLGMVILPELITKLIAMLPGK
jgi:TM2 domain-containing membrane protein YozV